MTERAAPPKKQRIDVVTIFPEYLDPLRAALLGRAIERGLIEVNVHDLRDWTHDVHRAVDDAPYGGGPGMVMAPEPWGRALDALAPGEQSDSRLVVPTPSGLPAGTDLAQLIDRRIRFYRSRRDRRTHLADGDRLTAAVADEAVGSREHRRLDLVLVR